MKIIWVFRKIDVNHDPYAPSGLDNPNGGVSSKVYHLSRSMPHVRITTELDAPHSICFCEALWFAESVEVEDKEHRVQQWEDLDAFKIVANSDLALLRLPGSLRDRIIDASDVLIATSEYGLQLFSAFTPKTVLLYDPIDVDMFTPFTKDREIYSIGNICPNKNIKGLIDLFSQIPKSLKLNKTYIGSSFMWGADNPESRELEAKLVQSVDNLENNLSRGEVAQRIRRIWAFIADSYYDMASFGMMEAMLCGCWIFAGRHLLYDERPCHRFYSVKEAIQLIRKQLEETPPESGIINEEGRQHIVDRNSYDAFRKQMSHLIGKYAYGI